MNHHYEYINLIQFLEILLLKTILTVEVENRKK